MDAFEAERHLIGWLAVVILAISPWVTPVPAAAHDECATSASAYGAGPTTLLEAQGPKEKLGAWYEVPLPPAKDRMQSVHAALLPSGKVLMVSGRSFRLTKKDGKIIEGVDGTNYDAVNNSALFDPPIPDRWRQVGYLAQNPSTRRFRPRAGTLRVRGPGDRVKRCV
jgi:hypothetical protein